MNFFGSQFQSGSHEQHINPALLDNSNSQNFERDVEIATVDEIPEQHQLDLHATPYVTVPHTPPRALNPEAEAYQPLAQQSSPPSQHFQAAVDGRRQPDPQTPEWRRTVPFRHSPSHQNQTPNSVQLHWQSNNLFAPLSPDWIGAQQGQYQQHPAYGEHWVPQPAFNQANAYLTPPPTGAYHGSGRTDHFEPRQFVPNPLPPVFNAPNSTGVLNPALSSTNLATLATQTQPSENLNQWNLQTYHPGDQTRPLPYLLPATPTRSIRSRRRGSATPSLYSTAGLTCETCGSGFTKRHELDHHRRNHGERTHVCSLCSKGFLFAKDLRRHMTTHNKEERHLFCNIIGCKYHHKGFGRKDHLRRHIEKKHPGGLLTPSATESGAGGG